MRRVNSSDIHNPIHRFTTYLTRFKRSGKTNIWALTTFSGNITNERNLESSRKENQKK
jgi:hypothetical protein